MIIATAISRNGVSIRLTSERWDHITLSHKEVDPGNPKSVTAVVESPDSILKGDTGEFLAVKKQSGRDFWIVVAYKETDKSDGFIITAYITTDESWLFQRQILWNKG